MGMAFYSDESLWRERPLLYGEALCGLHRIGQGRPSGLGRGPWSPWWRGRL